MKKRKIIQLKSTDIPFIREKILRKQKGICPILKKHFDEKDMVVDHLHSKHAKILNLRNAGCVRGVIHKQANSFEGKMTNSMIRMGLHKIDISFPDLLRNMATYLEQPALPYLHPSEAKKPKKVMKKSIKKLIKLFTKKYPHRKIPEVIIFKKYTKGKKKGQEKKKQLTKGLKRLYKEFGLKPEFYK